ncbi:hypothetical protein BT69DRAFT_52795 [Atractiella rhizophila]|nr:hypothetical protein BT69DRAFT_52795 [Atractiella rhizophila]
MERGERSTRPRQTTLTEKEDASIADLLPSESAPEDGIARQRMHAMCSGGQERASKGEREASQVREKRFLVPSPLFRVTFGDGASKRESSAREAWDAKRRQDSAVQHQFHYLLRSVPLSRFPYTCPSRSNIPLASLPCYSRHPSSSAPPATSVHSATNGA